MGQDQPYLSDDNPYGMINSKPLRFVVLVILLWSGVRIWMTYPVEAEILSAERQAEGAGTPELAQLSPPHLPHSPLNAQRRAVLRRSLPASSSPISYVAVLPPVRETTSVVGRANSSFAAQSQDLIAPLPMPISTAYPSRKVSGYAWLFAREGGEQGLAGAGLLGGSQAGMRLNYAVTNDLAATLRVSRPLEGRGGEGAVGVYWQPARAAPLTIIAERRIGLDRGGRDAFALIAAGGISGIKLPSATLDIYGQTGLVGMKARDPFIDGSSTVSMPVIDRENSAVSGGIGVWGSAQPGVSRVDLGPRLRAQINAGGTTLAASLDWRQRIAGRARPPSGLALTLEAGF